jgi:hypothetical protein
LVFSANPPFTNAVVASVVELSDEMAVGATGVPVNVGDALGALAAIKLSTYVLLALETKTPFTKAVVANVVELSVDAAVGAIGVPVKLGEANEAFELIALSTYDLVALAAMLPFTNAVVAMTVELSVDVAVGATGDPVNVGDTKLAFEVKALST